MREPVQNQDLLPTGYESIADALSRMDDGLEVPEDFHARWRYAVEKEAWQLKEKKHRNRRIGRLQWRVLAAAAAVVFLFGGTLLSRDAIHNAVNGAIVPSETAVTQDAIVAESYMAGDARAYGGANSRSLAATAAAEESTGTQPSVILRSASVTINSTQYEEDLRAIETALEEYGGWSESTYVSGEKPDQYSGGNGRYASLTLRVPAASLDAFLAQLDEIGTVTSLHTSTEDVSENYYDVQSRLSLYEAQRERLTELYEKAETVSDIIEIENSLTDLQYSIESLQGSLNHWDSYADTSVVNLSLQEIAVAQDKQEAGLFDRLGDALKTSWRSARAFFSDMLVFIVLALPYLALLAGVALIAFIAVSIRRKMHSKKDRDDSLSE